MFGALFHGQYFCDKYIEIMVTNIRINVKSISFGCEDLKLIFGDTVIPFYASYMGAEPISTLIDSLIALEVEIIENSFQRYHVIWVDEPGYLDLKMTKDKDSDILNMEIEYNNEGEGIYHKEESWKFQLSYKSYREAVISESLRLLNLYGLGGFNQNWCDGYDTFPINSLLILLGNIDELKFKDDIFYSDIYNDLNLLRKAL